jgi:hypothetical protein
MEDRKYSIEQTLKVWDDKLGDHIEISHDGDGTDLIAITYVDSKGKIAAFPYIYPLFAKAMAEAILKHELVRGAEMV